MAADTGLWISARNMSPISPYTAEAKSVNLLRPTSKIRASFRRNDFSLITKKSGQRASRPLITISTSDGKWDGKWSSDYTLSLQQLHLDDLAEDGHGNALVSINLCIHKHASFGLSVEGRIITSFTRKCRNCSSPYCREIDANFNVWVLPLSRRSGSTKLPEIGGDDPSVIYVKPGYEAAELDSLIQDALRLKASVKDTCSESCKKSEPKLQYIGQQKAASIDRRWSRLLELKNAPS